MPRPHVWIILASLVLAAFVVVPSSPAAVPAKKVRLAYSAFAYANPPFWIAHDLKLFEKYGLDTELVYVSGARPIQAMLGGSIDVSQVGGSPEVLGALTQGRFPAGVLTAPTTHMAMRMGFREIFDLGSLDFPFPTLSVVSTRKYSESNPEVILSVLRATSEAIHLYKTRPEVALPVIAKYMRVPKDDPALLQAQETFAKHLNLTLTLSLDGIKFILDFLAEQRPAVKGRNPADFVNVSFLKKLEGDEFFKKLSSSQ